MKKDDQHVLYADVTFSRNKNKNKANEKHSSDVEPTIYSEVNIRTPQQNPEPCAVSQRVKPRPGSKVSVERAVLVVGVVLLIAAVAALAVITWEHTTTKETLTSEKVKCEADRANLTETLSKMKSCPTARPPVCPTSPPENQVCSRCDPGWEPYGGNCYFFSVDRFSWEESGQRCKNLSGNLVKIESRDEQKFLAEKLTKKMEKDEDKFWIGLTDAAEEGEWRWVDGSELDDNLRFWSENEPDNWKGNDPDGENCARMGEKNVADLQSWFDHSCEVRHKMICEKAAESGKFEHVCVVGTRG